MSQSILSVNIQKYQNKFDKEVLELAYNYNLKKRFHIGVGLNYVKMYYTKMISSAVCNQNKDILKFIQRKISGELEDCGVKVEDNRIGHLKKYCDKTDGTCGFNTCELKIQW